MLLRRDQRVSGLVMAHLVVRRHLVMTLLRLAPPYGVHRSPVRDRHDPGLGLAKGAVESSRLAPDLEEHLLRNVLGPGRVPHDTARQPEHGRGQLVVQLFERGCVPPCYPSHKQIEVARPPGRHQPESWFRHARLLCTVLLVNTCSIRTRVRMGWT